jgi:hypothetical protein
LPKKQKLSALSFSLILFFVVATCLVSVNAQDTATVIVNSQTGGTTDITGTTTYPDGTEVTITAVPDSEYAFLNWVVSPSDGSGDTTPTSNPLTFTVTGDVTYTITPVFTIPAPVPGRPSPTDLASAAIVIILPSAGGTTSPAPGTYALENAENLNLVAMPDEGWEFSHWTICGNPTPHGTEPINWTPTDNPYNVNHGYGDTYRYQAVFTPIGSSDQPTPTPTSNNTGGSMAGLSNEMWIIIALVVVIIVILIGFGVYASRRR